MKSTSKAPVFQRQLSRALSRTPSRPSMNPPSAAPSAPTPPSDAGSERSDIDYDPPWLLPGHPPRPPSPGPPRPLELVVHLKTRAEVCKAAGIWTGRHAALSLTTRVAVGLRPSSLDPCGWRSPRGERRRIVYWKDPATPWHEHGELAILQDFTLTRRAPAELHNTVLLTNEV